jgi:hypothetical protein
MVAEVPVIPVAETFEMTGVPFPVVKVELVEIDEVPEEFAETTAKS